MRTAISLKPLSPFYVIFLYPVRKGNDRSRNRSMSADDLFCPDHVIQRPELAAAVIKFPYDLISQVLVKLSAVSGQIFVFFFRIADTGVEICDVLCPGDSFQSVVKFSFLSPFFAYFLSDRWSALRNGHRQPALQNHWYRHNRRFLLLFLLMR